MSGIREIAMTEMPEVSIGNVQNEEAKTGVTVLLFDKKTGAVVGVDISGGQPSSPSPLPVLLYHYILFPTALNLQAL